MKGWRIGARAGGAYGARDVNESVARFRAEGLLPPRSARTNRFARQEKVKRFEMAVRRTAGDLFRDKRPLKRERTFLGTPL